MSAQYIVRPATAFALTGGKKRPRDHKPDHLTFIRKLPCLITGKYGVEAAHIRYGDLRYGKPTGGAGMKPSDNWTVPLSPAEHRDQHQHDEAAWWLAKSIDPLAVASALYAVSGDEEAACLIIQHARANAKRPSP